MPLLPYGLLLLTLIYATFAVAVNRLAPECLHEPCSSEGIENTTSGWATDFFIALAMILLSLHLWLTTKAQIYGTLTVGSMGVGYIFGGLGHGPYPNTGAGDGKGQVGFWASWLVSFFFLTLSSFFMYLWADVITASRSSKSQRQRKGYCCCLNPSNVMLLLLLWNIMAFSLIASGCVWCLSTPEIHTPEIIDPFEHVGSEATPTCLLTMGAGELMWYPSYASLFIPFAIWVVRDVTTMCPPIWVWGLNMTFATKATPFVQWTFGFMYIIWMIIAAALLGLDAAQLYADTEAAIIYHYAVLVTFLILHNLAWAYPVKNMENEESKRNSEADGDIEAPSLVAPVVWPRARFERHSLPREIFDYCGGRQTSFDKQQGCFSKL